MLDLRVLINPAILWFLDGKIITSKCVGFGKPANVLDLGNLNMCWIRETSAGVGLRETSACVGFWENRVCVGFGKPAHALDFGKPAHALDVCIPAYMLDLGG